MSPAQNFFPTYFRPRNQYEIASGLCSVLIVLCPLIGHMAFQLFPQGIFSAMVYTKLIQLLGEWGSVGGW